MHISTLSTIKQLVSYLFLVGIPAFSLAQSNYVANTSNANGPGAYNTLVGVKVGLSIADNGWFNTFTGYQAGFSNTEGGMNVFFRRLCW